MPVTDRQTDVYPKWLARYFIGQSDINKGKKGILIIHTFNSGNSYDSKEKSAQFVIDCLWNTTERK